MNTELKQELQSLRERIAELENKLESDLPSDSPTWENVAVGKKGWYITTGSNIADFLIKGKLDHSCFPEKHQAEAALAEAQLLWFRDYYRNGWKPKMGVTVYVVYVNNGCILYMPITYTCHIMDMFSFPTEESAQSFLNNHKDLLEIWGKKFQP